MTETDIAKAEYVPTFTTGRAIPKRKGGAVALPNVFADVIKAMAAEVNDKGATPDGQAQAAEYPGVTERKHVLINRAWRDLTKAGREHNVRVGRTFEVETTGTGKTVKAVGVVTFWIDGPATADDNK
jgi:hypothetical protein